ncbi:MAG: hypothetical protein ACU84J_07640 [Gammaproteobacteria bacterium]
MAKILLNALQPGMVLTEDTVHANGRVLLKAGSVITENHIKIFKTWGVSYVEVVTDTDDGIDNEKTHSQDAIKQAIEVKRGLFKYCDLEHPFINALFRVSVKTFLNKTFETDR